jgi:hypothetical protein
MEKHFVKVLFSDNDVISTTINGSHKEITDYYFNNTFVDNQENLRTVKLITFLE